MKEVDSTRSILRNEAEIIFRTFKYLPNINCVLYILAHNSSYPRKFGKRKKKKRKRFFRDDIYFNIESGIIQGHNTMKYDDQRFKE